MPACSLRCRRPDHQRDEATGELVNVTGPGTFAGYYKNPEADAERMRNGQYWSGDLAYTDVDGYVYFAGRSSGWLRVDGENIGAAPIERSLVGYPASRRCPCTQSPTATSATASCVGDSGRRCRQLRPGSRSRIHRFPAGTRAEAEADLDPSVQ